MTNPIDVEKTSDLKKLNIHSNFILNKFNTRVSILLLLHEIVWSGREYMCWGARSWAHC